MNAEDDLDYRRHKAIIAKGIAEALARIRDSQLYRPHYETFEQYCFQKWNVNPEQITSFIKYFSKD